MNARIVNLGFSVADGGGLKTSFENGILKAVFTDWREKPVEFECHNTVAYRWQLAEHSLSKDERFDSVHEIEGSEWLCLHAEQGYLREGIKYHHYKMNFNAEGIFELLCSEIKIQNEKGA